MPGEVGLARCEAEGQENGPVEHIDKTGAKWCNPRCMPSDLPFPRLFESRSRAAFRPIRRARRGLVARKRGSMLVGLALLAAWAQPVRPANPSPATAAPVHHVIVVENTTRMKAQREQTADLVSRSMLDGFHGRARIGEIVELWIVEGGQITTNALPAFRWHPLASIDNSNSAYRTLRSLKPEADHAALGEVIRHLNIAHHPAPRLLAYLLTSGFDDLEGTPFDEAVNRIFLDHRGGLAEAGHPFVTVLAGQEGAWVEHSVTPGDRTPFIPSFPPLQAELEARRQAELASKKPVRTPQPLILKGSSTPMTVAEIEQKLREAALERARTSPPPSTATSAAPPPPSEPSPSATPASVPSTQAVPPAEPEPEPAVQQTQPPAVEATPRLAETSSESAPPTNRATSQPGQPTSPPQASPPAMGELAPPEGPTPRVQAPRPAAPAPLPVSPWKDCLVGALLLLAAGALTVILLRQVRRPPHPSLITESLDQRSNPPTAGTK